MIKVRFSLLPFFAVVATLCIVFAICGRYYRAQDGVQIELRANPGGAQLHRRAYVNDIYLGETPLVLSKARLQRLGFTVRNSKFGWRHVGQRAVGSWGVMFFDTKNSDQFMATLWFAAEDGDDSRYLTVDGYWGRCLSLIETLSPAQGQSLWLRPRLPETEPIEIIGASSVYLAPGEVHLTYHLPVSIVVRSRKRLPPLFQEKADGEIRVRSAFQNVRNLDWHSASVLSISQQQTSDETMEVVIVLRDDDPSFNLGLNTTFYLQCGSEEQITLAQDWFTKIRDAPPKSPLVS